MEAHHCHCGSCRKAHGAAFATYAAVSAAQLRVIAGEERLISYRSTPPVCRTFCGTCGSSLFFSHEAVPELRWVALGTIDGEIATGARPDAHTFVVRRATWWAIDDTLPQYDGQRPEYG
jgi:hypothetical protein